MAYVELKVGRKEGLVLDGTAYDIDYFGMLDGDDDQFGRALRFTFQLGSGLMIYVYAVEAGTPDRPDRQPHRLWLTDCAAAEVDQEDLGVPADVRADAVKLPCPYAAVRLGATRLTIRGLVFSAHGEEAAAVFDLDGDAELRWSRRAGWQLAARPSPPRPLAVDEWPRFERDA